MHQIHLKLLCQRATWAGYVVPKYIIEKSYGTKLIGRLSDKCKKILKWILYRTAKPSGMCRLYQLVM